MDGPRYVPPEQYQAGLHKDQQRQLRDAQRSTGTERNRTLEEVQAALAAAQEALAQVVAVQNAQAAQLAILNSTRPTSASGGNGLQPVGANSWATTDQPSVTFVTATGVARIDVQAMLFSAGDAAIATFGIYTNLGAPVVSRESRRDAWKGFTNGVLGAVGGSGFDVIGGLPVNTPLIARFECYAYNANAQFRSPSISAAGTA
ncbi:hypothetical protein SAMN06295974_0365 [Plantibacter flavus]|uniref:Uncharacterized protein n=1 Tax=Plantibacter flavus TaxID=150123 RepID=A0A3N2C114_9MICO|nr:hypothetical protein [Plantibacter flavus]ROR81140.1 hypothetical protein EDD42_1192 [Plantibacter flavus]SMG08281.1 hypothetical protein SAMN06295974_0365 [Plantibacter flavus]